MDLGFTTSGLWKLRNEVQLVAGMKACYTRFGLGVDAIAGWGHKPTAKRARRLARIRQVPYLAFEDGFLRSVNPGNTEPPLALVLDRTGIYYDSRQPCDLEALVRRRAKVSGEVAKARSALEQLKEKRLSKYNNFSLPDVTGLNLNSTHANDRILIVDQTEGDASIEGAFSSGETFEIMLVRAVDENPGCEFLIKIHPETASGRKGGHFSAAQLESFAEHHPSIGKAHKEKRLRLTPEPVNPWGLLEACSKVYCVSSQLGFEALLAGCEVHCFGVPFYAGWGLTKDRQLFSGYRRGRASLEALFAAVYFDYCHYLDHENQTIVGLDEALVILERRITSGSLEHG